MPLGSGSESASRGLSGSSVIGNVQSKVKEECSSRRFRNHHQSSSTNRDRLNQLSICMPDGNRTEFPGVEQLFQKENAETGRDTQVRFILESLHKNLLGQGQGEVAANTDLEKKDNKDIFMYVPGRSRSLTFSTKTATRPSLQTLSRMGPGFLDQLLTMDLGEYNGARNKGEPDENNTKKSMLSCITDPEIGVSSDAKIAPSCSAAKGVKDAEISGSSRPNTCNSASNAMSIAPYDSSPTAKRDYVGMVELYNCYQVMIELQLERLEFEKKFHLPTSHITAVIPNQISDKTVQDFLKFSHFQNMVLTNLMSTYEQLCKTSNLCFDYKLDYFIRVELLTWRKVHVEIMQGAQSSLKVLLKSGAINILLQQLQKAVANARTILLDVFSGRQSANGEQ